MGYHLSDDLNAESVVKAVKGRNKDIPPDPSFRQGITVLFFCISECIG